MNTQVFFQKIRGDIPSTIALENVRTTILKEKIYKQGEQHIRKAQVPKFSYSGFVFACKKGLPSSFTLNILKNEK